MIIYKTQDNGRATDFQFSRKCPEGWKSIPGDRIPEDISIYHEQRYIDAQRVKETQSLCIKYLNESEIHVSGDPPYPDGVQKWKDARVIWRTILKSGKAQEVPGKPF